MFFTLCAAAGLRIGEALGIDIKYMSPDCSTIKIRQKTWQGKIQDFLKTENGKREIDLHSSVAALLKEFIGDRKSGCSSVRGLASRFQPVEHPAALAASDPEAIKLETLGERATSDRALMPSVDSAIPT